MKDFLFHKLTVRVAYIVAAYSSSHLISLLAQPTVQNYLPHTGLQITVVDPVLVQTWMNGLLLIAGEFVFHFINKNYIPQKGA